MDDVSLSLVSCEPNARLSYACRGNVVTFGPIIGCSALVDIAQIFQHILQSSLGIQSRAASGSLIIVVDLSLRDIIAGFKAC